MSMAIPSSSAIPSNSNMKMFQTPALKPFAYDNSSPRIDRSVTPDSENSPDFSLSDSRESNAVFTSFMKRAATTDTDAQIVSPSQEKVRELWDKKAQLLLAPKKTAASSLSNSSALPHVRRNLASVFEASSQNPRATLSNFSIKQITSFFSSLIQ